MNTVSSETTTQSRNLSFKASRAGRHPNAGTGAIAVGRNLAEDLAKLEPQTLQRNFRGAGNRFGVLLAIVTAVLLVAATLACNFLSVPQEITRWVTRVSCVAVPFSLLLALKQALSSSNIKFVQYVLRIADPGAHLRQAEQLVFNCDLLEAEKMLEGELKNAAAKQRSYISTCSALALVRAHMGKSDAAAQMIAMLSSWLSTITQPARATHAPAFSAPLLHMPVRLRSWQDHRRRVCILTAKLLK